jgi:predicted ABC-type transport system involved in lysophospholipase L1 biosynthesis ATPase subunit
MSCVLGYEPVPDEEAPERVWVESPGEHCVSASYKDELVAALHDLRPRDGARLVLFGAEVGALDEAERAALLRRVGFVPASGGLMSNLNAWENISLPVAYHTPARLPEALAEVHALLGELGGVGASLLAKLPENMTLYERRLAAYLRALLERPELLVVENLDGGLGPTKRGRIGRFAEVYRARCPAGTFVRFDG